MLQIDYTGSLKIMVGQKLHLRAIKRPLKGTKSSFKPVHLFLHFGTFGLVVLQLILASKLSELEQFENFLANNQLESKQE